MWTRAVLVTVGLVRVAPPTVAVWIAVRAGVAAIVAVGSSSTSWAARLTLTFASVVAPCRTSSVAPGTRPSNQAHFMQSVSGEPNTGDGSGLGTSTTWTG